MMNVLSPKTEEEEEDYDNDDAVLATSSTTANPVCFFLLIPRYFDLVIRSKHIFLLFACSLRLLLCLHQRLPIHHHPW